jgi:adenine-specific DNA-methyltransferase
MSFIDMVQHETTEYLSSVTKTKRKALGQFFTPISIAEYMGRMSQFTGQTVRILDPGAGSGILTASVIDTLVGRGISHLQIDMYETDSNVLPVLESNISAIKASLLARNIVLDYKVITENFISENQFAWTGLLPNEIYDIVICNPPYKKIGKDSLEANLMSDIVYGQPNLYFLFMAMGAKLLKDGGEFVYIVPRSFSSGLYFSAFRKWFLSEMRITNLHLFASREAIGGTQDSVLQETVIIRAIKTTVSQSRIEITESIDENCAAPINRSFIDYRTCVKNDNNTFLYFPTSKQDAHILDFVNKWTATLPELGFRMKTGQLVDFRERKWLCATQEEDTIPLLWPFNFSNARIRFPVDVSGKPQYLKDTSSTKRLQMSRGSYLLIKRFTAKEEKRRLQCALLLEDDLSGYNSLSAENHLNYISKETGVMTTEELYGLFVIINSSYLDKYFRILNGSTQVNATEINAIPFPELDSIRALGTKAMQCGNLDESICDFIIEDYFMIEQSEGRASLLA